MRYIVNTASKEIHDSKNLKEECNTDQIEFKEAADAPCIEDLILYRKHHLCRHCFGD